MHPKWCENDAWVSRAPRRRFIPNVGVGEWDSAGSFAMWVSGLFDSSKWHLEGLPGVPKTRLAFTMKNNVFSTFGTFETSTFPALKHRGGMGMGSENGISKELKKLFFWSSEIATSSVAAIESACWALNFFHVFLMKNRNFKSAQIEENLVFYNENAFAQGIPKGWIWWMFHTFSKNLQFRSDCTSLSPAKIRPRDSRRLLLAPGAFRQGSRGAKSSFSWSGYHVLSKVAVSPERVLTKPEEKR